MKSRRSRITLLAISLVLYAFLYAPIVVIMLQSFNSARHGTAWGGFTTNWYALIIHNELAVSAALVTLSLAAASTVVSVVLGTLLAMALGRGCFPAQTAAEWMLRTIIVVPDIVMAVALLLFYAIMRKWLGFFEPGFLTMMLAHITFQIPFVTLVVRARLSGLDRSLAEAARDLGATSWQTFRHITLPLIGPGILAGALLAFTLSLDDFVVSFFTTGPGATTLPILIYSSVKRGLTPEIHALSTLLVFASLVATATVMLLQRQHSNCQTPASRQASETP